ncbi:hypothetical protein IE077_003764 [Cardiosporidium cionae]|uniref:Signal recognition particle subunit SRP68 n=1 Tax=Cardiosporidium cionae TaxID=476202 RepID=A0ABQ7J8H5_9APIC|nr:hypothetical protein IE077_003764 [Cardiosporidium cionae]|eukprot:KAF8819955.1 hypothetical protein IE077_003764 [Cardiosporidium cionae]
MKTSKEETADGIIGPFTSLKLSGAQALKKAEASPVSLSLAISVEINDMQLRNGLKYLDFHRYWLYCSRRIKRLRNQLHFKHGRKQFHSKPFPEEITDVRYLRYLLLLTERAWSHGNCLKYEHAISSSVKPRVKLHAIRRFAKAASYAFLLEKCCEKFSDRKTYLDAQAYHSWMESIVLLDRKRYEKAFKSLSLSQNVFLQLKWVSIGNKREEVAFRKKLEELEVSLRLCQYHLGQQSHESLSNITKFQTSEVSPVLPVPSLLSNESNEVLQCRNNSITLSLEQLELNIFHCKRQFDSLCIPIHSLEANDWKFLAELLPLSVIETYGEVSALFQEVLQKIQMKSLTFSTDPQNTWILLQGYTIDMQNILSLERNILLLLLFLSKMHTAEEGKKTNAEEGLRYSDLLAQDLEKMLHYEEENTEDASILILLQWAGKILRICRALCFSLLLFSLEKYDNALVLADFVRKHDKHISALNEAFSAFEAPDISHRCKTETSSEEFKVTNA